MSKTNMKNNETKRLNPLALAAAVSLVAAGSTGVVRAACNLSLIHI